MGNFKFINLVTGEDFAGGRCFLPEPLQSMVEAQLEGSNNVQFAFDITVVESESVTGYEYGAETVVKPSDNDPLELLLARTSEDKPLEIAAPKKTTEKAA